MRIKLAGFFMVLIMFLALPGCWSRVEVESLAISTMIGIDKVEIKGEKVYRVSAKIIRTGQLGLGQGGSGGIQRPPTWTISGLGNTLLEASRNMLTRSPRQVFHAHSKFIVLSEEVAKEGVQPILDILLRQRDIRLRNWMLISKTEAINVIELEPELEKLLNEEVQGIIEQTQPRVSRMVAVDLKDFATALATPGRDIAISKVECFNPPESSNKIEIDKTFGAPPNKPSGNTVRITGAAVFKKDKLVGYIGDWEAQGLLFVINETKGGVIPVTDIQDEFTFDVTRSETEIKSQVENGEITFNILVNTEGDIGEHLSAHKIGSKEIAKHEELIAKDIRDRIEKVTAIAQKDFGADIFGFGEKLRRQHNSQWQKVKKNWRQVFAEAKVNVQVKVKIRRTGMISNPLQIK